MSIYINKTVKFQRPASLELFELHGNSNLEVCKSCHREYLRDFRTRSAAKVHNHLTGTTFVITVTVRINSFPID